tara:strand:+ start:5993 stop:7099 length:1107 start_codon:yes stop_codon:yes gene_type:complete
MAHLFRTPNKDAILRRGASVAGTSSAQNFGGDEILEVGKSFQAEGTSVSAIQRSVIKFDITDYSASQADGSIGEDVKYYLNLYDAGSFELTRDNNDIEVFTVSQSWTEGDGKLSDDPAIEEGVSWRYRTGVSESLAWSATNSEWGGTYFSSSFYSASFSFSKSGSDARIDVTDIVKTLIAGSASNEGFLIKRTSDIENSTANYGVLKFFSSDSHTIFKPTLEAEWDDATWSTGSLSALDLDELGNLDVYMNSFRREYKLGTVSKIRVKGREKYPARTFGTSSAYLDCAYFPSASSFYSIVDSKNHHTIIPFGSGSKLSCDSTSNFFKLTTAGLEPERYYNVLFKIISGSGATQTVQFIDNDYQFKVVE